MPPPINPYTPGGAAHAAWEANQQAQAGAHTWTFTGHLHAQDNQAYDPTEVEEEEDEDVPTFAGLDAPPGVIIDLYGRQYVPHAAVPGDYPHSSCACWACVADWLHDRGIERGSTGSREYRSRYRDRMTYWRRTYADQNQPYPRPSLNTDTLQQQIQLHEMREAARSNLNPPQTAEQRIAAIITSRSERWATLPKEVLLSQKQRSLLPDPLRWILRKGGRVWSAEVEVNGLQAQELASFLGFQTGNYSTRPDRPTILASSDATVDAEIKVSCMRDGSLVHKDMSVTAYDAMRNLGVFCATNTGHHVHVDATHIADHGFEASRDVVHAITQLGYVAHNAIDRIVASGYERHRFGDSAKGSRSRIDAWDLTPTAMEHRSHFHGERLAHASRDQSGRNATVEFRLPNGTLEPIRGHAYISIALAMLDWAERAVMDKEPQALEALKIVLDRTSHAAAMEEHVAAAFLKEHLSFSHDSLKAIAVASHTSPATAKHKRVWASATGLSTKDLGE